MRLEVTKAGRDCSDVGGIVLASLAQCQLAAKSLGKVYSDTVSWNDVPQGCILSVLQWNYDNVYWNTHTGGTYDGYKAICKISGKNYIDQYSINVYYK